MLRTQGVATRPTSHPRLDSAELLLLVHPGTFKSRGPSHAGKTHLLLARTTSLLSVCNLLARKKLLLYSFLLANTLPVLQLPLMPGHCGKPTAPSLVSACPVWPKQLLKTQRPDVMCAGNHPHHRRDTHTGPSTWLHP